MFKIFYAPEKLFAFSMWLVSLVFAAFLVGLGGKIIADVPSATTPVSVESFTNPQVMWDSRNRLDGAEDTRRKLEPELAEAQAVAAARQTAYATAQSANRNWLATRSVTSTNPDAVKQDRELLRQSKELEALSASLREAQVKVEELSSQMRAALREEAEARSAMTDQLRDAQPQVQSASRAQELKIFGLRLALTGPLLLVSTWLIVKKRKSSHWPLARGFIMFSLFAFFVELVPDLPSYGGYVRYGVGLLLSLVGGHYGIKWMQGFLARRQAEANRNETERRSSLDKVQAVQKIVSKVCPGCERPIPAELDGVKVDNCVYCGLRLFDLCEGKRASGDLCGVRKNAFYPHCPSCGTAQAAA